MIGASFIVREGDNDASGNKKIRLNLIFVCSKQEHYFIEQAEPKDALRFLMDARGLKQEDLAEIIHQSNLSAILAGKRKISAAWAGKLGKFFDISPALFVPR